MQFAIPILEIEAFLLVIIRVGGILFFAPIFGGRPVPMIVKASISLWIAFSFYTQINLSSLPAPDDGFAFTLAVMTELMIGAAIGLVAQVINVAVQFGGTIIGTHMGIRISNVLDPSSEVTTTIVGAFMNVVVVLLLLTFDFHLILLRIVAHSYEVIPPLGASFRLGVIDVLVHMGSNVFLYAMQIVMPVMAAIFFVEVIIGIMAKTARQFNMLMLQFPIKILVGLMFFSVLIRGLPEAIMNMLQATLEQIDKLINIMGP